MAGEGSGEEEEEKEEEDRVMIIQDLLLRIADTLAAAVAARSRQQKAGDPGFGLGRWVVQRLVINLGEETKGRIRLLQTDGRPLGDSGDSMMLEKAAHGFLRRLVSQIALQGLVLGQPDGGSVYIDGYFFSNLISVV